MGCDLHKVGEALADLIDADWNGNQIPKVQSRGDGKRKRQTAEICLDHWKTHIPEVMSSRALRGETDQEPNSAWELLKGFKAAVVSHGGHIGQDSVKTKLEPRMDSYPIPAPLRNLSMLSS